MKTQSDNRRLRIYMVNVVDGKPVSDHAADAWQEADGTVVVSGLWDGLIPYAQEDHLLLASQVGVSPLEWLRMRLATVPTITTEIFK